MSRRAPPCSSLRPVGASQIPDQFRSSGTNPLGQYLLLYWLTLDKRLTFSNHIDLVRKKAAQRLWVLWTLLNRSSRLSIRKAVLLYKQHICPLMDYACPVWRSTACSHIRNLQVIQSKCLHIVTNAPGYIANNQIHDFFTEHIRSLINSTQS